MNPPYPPMHPMHSMHKQVEAQQMWELAEKIFIQSYSNKPYMKTNDMIKLSVEAATLFRLQQSEAMDKIRKEMMPPIPPPPPAPSN